MEMKQVFDWFIFPEELRETIKRVEEDDIRDGCYLHWYPSLDKDSRYTKKEIKAINEILIKDGMVIDANSKNSNGDHFFVLIEVWW